LSWHKKSCVFNYILTQGDDRECRRSVHLWSELEKVAVEDSQTALCYTESYPGWMQQKKQQERQSLSFDGHEGDGPSKRQGILPWQ